VYFFRCPLVYYFNFGLQLDENPRGRGKSRDWGLGTGDSAEKFSSGGGGAPRGAGPRPLTALQRGERVHELLERADFTTPPTTETTRLVSQLDDVSPDESTSIEGMLRNILSDPLIERVRAAPRVEREYPFFLDIAGTRVEGKIDLVFQDADGRGVVVDYKSNDLAGPGRLQTLTDLYRPQIELYALAAKRAGLVSPNEGTLYFLNKAQAVPLAVDAERLDSAERRAGDALSSIARSGWDTEPGEKCRGCGYRKRGYCEVGIRFVE
jgi:ATP-dependent helicase/nuclease subunit A